MFRYTRLTRLTMGIALQHLTLASALMGMPTVALGNAPNPPPTKEEMAMVPPYCSHVRGYAADRDPEYVRWSALLGVEIFKAMHHYCWGLINLPRALRSRSNNPGESRKWLLQHVRGDFDYVIRNARKDFILLPEILTRKGDVELHLSLPGDANKSFAQARALKPDYWPAYSHWAGFLIYSGKSAEAKPLLRTALEYSPNTAVLREMYRSLGGNPSDIVPKVKEPAPDKSADKIATPPVAEERNPGKDEAPGLPGARPD